MSEVTLIEDKPPFDVDTFRFSASSLKTARQCGTKFKFEKVDRIKPPLEVGHARWLGKVVHASIYQSVGKLDVDAGFKEWELVRQDPLEHAALALFEALWVGGTDERTKKIYELEVGSSVPLGRFMKKAKVASLNTDDQVALADAWKVEARQMVKNGVKILKDYKIVQLERGVEFKYLDKDFSGFLDVVAEDEEGKVVYLDFKTVWDKPTPAKLLDDPQFVLYSHALKETLGLDYYPTGYFVHLRSGAAVPYVYSEVSSDKMKKSISGTFSDLKDGVFYHRPGVLCGYCDFASICPK